MDSEHDGSFVFRLDPTSDEPSTVVTDFVKPNGQACSPDESLLYIVDTGATDVEDGPQHIRVFEVTYDSTLSNGRIFATCETELFDGFRIGTNDNVWTSAGDGLHCYTPEGELIGKILINDVVANVEFGEIKRNRLFSCATRSLHAVCLNT